MFHLKYLFYFILLHGIIATSRINLYQTDRVSQNNADTLQHNCLRVSVSFGQTWSIHEVIAYCMSESPSHYDIKTNNSFSIFTFAELSALNVTSEQLYLWSAPIDLIENYEFYLTHPTTSNSASMGREVFHNCTLPKFGPMCQYEFDYYRPYRSSLEEMIVDFYHTYVFDTINLTCYDHLQCYRGPSPACLDWTEICDGRIDCLDGGLDEEHCGQLALNEDKNNGYDINQDMCVQNYDHHQDHYDLLNSLGDCYQQQLWHISYAPCVTNEPSLDCEDQRCARKPLTSSCSKQRQKRLFEGLFSVKDNSTSDDCWSAFKCVIPISRSLSSICSDFCIGTKCVEIIEDTCPDMFFIPIIPVLFGQIYFAYEKNDSKIFSSNKFQHPYICYNNSRYDHYFTISSKVLFSNVTCYRNEYTLNSIVGEQVLDEYYLRNTYNALNRYNEVFNYSSTFCNRTNVYQCINSSICISIRRQNDFVPDCPLGDDEYGLVFNHNDTTEQEGGITCETCMDADHVIQRYVRRNVSFQTICDGYTELSPVTINNKSETDETGCEQWQCDNTYTRCNGLWNCFNGADELHCGFPSPVDCSSSEHTCVSPDGTHLMCLPVEKANNGEIDCLGATDEPALCRKKYIPLYPNFYCISQHAGKCLYAQNLCSNITQCDNGDDRRFCQRDHNLYLTSTFCDLNSFILTQIEQAVCHSLKYKQKQKIVYFSLSGIIHFDGDSMKIVKNIAPPGRSIFGPSLLHQSRCHRGLDLRAWLDDANTLSTSTCLCPPNYYGAQCQYQNQRVSVTIKFRALSDSWRTPFAIVISLFDDSDEPVIHSYEQYTYLSVRDCKMKFNSYLLYSTRSKNQTKNYTIRLDIYEKISSLHRGSLLFPITFNFLPVHRFSFVIDIPRSDDNVQRYSSRQCTHGTYIQYSNTEQATGVCQCDRGWSGRYCTVPHHCTCSLDSLYIGVLADNRSICICPVYKFGPRCLLSHTVCQTNGTSTCKNRGQCVPSDEYMTSTKTFICICLKGYTGDRCEIVERQIILSFEKDIVLLQSLFVHFIQVMKKSMPIRVTTFTPIPFTQGLVIIPWSRPFHLVFIELSKNNYYLTAVEKTYNKSSTINKLITSSDRCHHISEVFNKTFAELHLLHRIKYYHLACQNDSMRLSCFYDDVHLCLCYDHGQKRLANCLQFNHSMTFDCLGQSECKNEGQCFQDAHDCPQRSMCLCRSCFYGRRCQFSTSGFGLSLDAILGYHIQQHLGINDQPTIVRISMALTIVFIMAGLMNGIFAMITFKNEKIREVGCGLYLFGSSMTTVLTVVVFGLKYFMLILTQMTLISNRSFLQIQCISLDYLLRVCLNIDQWLNACVASERAMTTIKGTRFNRKKSKQAAKIVIVIVVLFNIAVFIHEPLYRHLIDEENDDEKRIWCIVTYSPNVQIFNSFMLTFQFFAPFMINLISAVILITRKSRQQSNLRTDQTRKALLLEQLRQHQNLLTAPVVLVLLAIPRLIISYVSKCLKSADDSWLFLIAYYISFISPMLTFVIFILPSKFYKKEFYKSVARYRTSIQKHLQFSS